MIYSLKNDWDLTFWAIITGIPSKYWQNIIQNSIFSFEPKTDKWDNYLRKEIWLDIINIKFIFNFMTFNGYTRYSKCWCFTIWKSEFFTAYDYRNNLNLTRADSSTIYKKLFKLLYRPKFQYWKILDEENYIYFGMVEHGFQFQQFTLTIHHSYDPATPIRIFSPDSIGL